MDPLSLIITALAAGASAAVKETAGKAVKDGYEGLKALIRRKFAGKPPAETALEEHEADPDTWHKPLEKALRDVHADEDEDLLAMAKELLKTVDPEGASQGKYSVTISGGQGIYVGDKGAVTMDFGDGAERAR